MRPARRTLPAPTEHLEHIVVADYLRARRILFTHPGNGEKRSAITGARLKRMGLSAGCCDFLIFDAPLHMLGVVGCAIELKRKGSPPSAVTPEQREWLDALNQRGWKTTVARGADEAIAWLESLFGKAPR